ncbi:endonuclease domain-containing protein [Pseudarthrobacter sp. P1]|uniref:endonuclease domain-containing protein n=1 Tax=Pseudarthrobacter sp. P1 TaxID=3418418 RepID=UPI003CEAB36F
MDASHLTAARLHGIPLPYWAEHEAEARTIHLMRPGMAANPRRRGVKGHRGALAETERTEVRGVPATSLARTWLDLAGILSLDELVAAGDHLVCEHHHGDRWDRPPRLPLGELATYIGGKGPVRNIGRARSALALLRVGADSPPETYLRLMLARSGLPDFVPDCPVSDDAEPPAWTDLGCPDYRICAEYEGAHHATPAQQAADRRRDDVVARAGWRQIKIYARDMALGEQWVVSHFRQALYALGWTPE